MKADDVIQRVPGERIFLAAEWRYLAMLNYEVDPAVLRPFVPAGTELDSWGGKTFVSLVAFLFLNTRVRGFGIPFHRNFEEVNLRFYVRRLGPEGWRRGVVFVKEIVPRLAIAVVARLWYNENYVALPTRHRLEIGPESIVADYAWRWKGRWNQLQVMTTGSSSLVKPESLEEFITEHYWGYAAQKNGGCVEYKVEHPKWHIWQTQEAVFDCDIETLYGNQFAPFLKVAPGSAFLAEGSAVKVFGGRIV